IQLAVGTVQSLIGLPELLAVLHVVLAAMTWVGSLRVLLDTDPRLWAVRDHHLVSPSPVSAGRSLQTGIVGSRVRDRRVNGAAERPSGHVPTRMPTRAEWVASAERGSPMSDVLIDRPELASLGQYEFGWADPDAAGASARRGLNEDVVRDISRLKNEPEWMLNTRLKALKLFGMKPMPT